jgi:hypothetical protein
MAVKSGIGFHQSSRMGKDEWITPQWLLEALGEFDLDPCSPAHPPWKIADRFYTKEQDGLSLPWEGRVFCNPPYGRETERWLKRCSEHGEAIALVFARTETKMFFNHVWSRASGLFFPRGRILFHHVDGTPRKWTGGAPSVLIAYNAGTSRTLKELTIEGAYLPLDHVQVNKEKL